MKESYSNIGKPIDESILNYIRNHFSYDHVSGVITRNDRANSSGSFDKDGYLILKIKGKQYKAHRLAWFLYYGEFPTKEIDHVNRVRTDNRISNLREVDRLTNIENTNKKVNPETGVVGVYYDKSTKGLKKRFTTRLKGETYRFGSVDDAVKFRENNNLITRV